jgi:hypothetical protein
MHRERVSKEHQPPHVNRWSGEVLENKEQVCPACHLNFGTTEVGDVHRVGAFGQDRRCIRPGAANLIETTNKFGTTIWRKK